MTSGFWLIKPEVELCVNTVKRGFWLERGIFNVWLKNLICTGKVFSALNFYLNFKWLFKIKEEKRFGLKYSENESCQYLIVSFLANEDPFIENLIKSGQKLNRIFTSVQNYDLGEKVFKNTVQLRRRSKSTDRFRSGIRNSINIELWLLYKNYINDIDLLSWLFYR